jgi:hypothetical protein
VGIVWGVGGDVLFLVGVFVEGAFIRVLEEHVMCVSSLLGVMHGSQVGRKSVERGVVSLGTFPCSVLAGRMRAALKDSIVVRKGSLMPFLSPLDTLSIITLVGCI